MFASSKTITNERSPRTGAVALVEMRCRPGGAVAGDSRKSTDSKAEMVWGRPSSWTVKSAWVRPSTGLPWRSRTTTSTFTTSTLEGNAVAAWGAGGGWGRASPTGAPAAARASSTGATIVRMSGVSDLRGTATARDGNEKTGAGLLPPPHFTAYGRLDVYHSNRAPRRMARGAW